MKMRNVLSNTKSRQGISSRSAGTIGRDSTNNLHTGCRGSVEDGASAHTADCHAVDQVSVPFLLSGTNISGEKTESVGCDRRESKSADLSPDVEHHLSWEQWYQLLWKFKISRVGKDYR